MSRTKNININVYFSLTDDYSLILSEYLFGILFYLIDIQ